MLLAVAFGLIVAYCVFKALFWPVIVLGIVLGILKTVAQRATG